MAREVHKFGVTVPAGTLQANPQVSNLNIPPRELTSVEVIVPPGPNGTVGWQLAAAGRQLIPYEPGAFIVASNEKVAWELRDQITSGAWQLIAYNTGAFPHTLEIRFLVDLPAAAAAPSLLPPSLLSSS
jgi:hypothetical protein